MTRGEELRIQRAMEFSKLKYLQKIQREAEDAYLDLRDAKSSGCCAGMNLFQVLEYDSKIEAAHKKLRETLQEVKNQYVVMAKIQREILSLDNEEEM
jgi:hypothetical protein